VVRACSSARETASASFGPVRRTADHVRRDRNGEQLEADDEDDRAGRGEARVADRDGQHHADQAEDLRLGPRVHPREEVVEAHQADGGDQGQQRSDDQEHGREDVEHGTHVSPPPGWP
jgi:hypothetical protein